MDPVSAHWRHTHNFRKCPNRWIPLGLRKSTTALPVMMLVPCIMLHSGVSYGHTTDLNETLRWIIWTAWLGSLIHRWRRPGVKSKRQPRGLFFQRGESSWRWNCEQICLTFPYSLYTYYLSKIARKEDFVGKGVFEIFVEYVNAYYLLNTFISNMRPGKHQVLWKQTNTTCYQLGPWWIICDSLVISANCQNNIYVFLVGDSYWTSLPTVTKRGIISNNILAPNLLPQYKYGTGYRTVIYNNIIETQGKAAHRY